MSSINTQVDFKKQDYGNKTFEEVKEIARKMNEDTLRKFKKESDNNEE